MSKNRNRNRNRNRQNPGGGQQKILTVTHKGFMVKIPVKRFADYELIDLLGHLEADENPIYVPRIMRMLLGERQHQAMIEHFREPDGSISMEPVNELLQEIAGKNPNS